jgi:alpha-tubulin suppressor-like RCC1 family protein
VHTDGTAWCWGENTDGQLGTAEPFSSQTPIQVPGSWVQVVAGVGASSATTCGIKQDLSAWCWGAGGSGQLGNGDPVSSATPVAVAGGHHWAMLTVGEVHACGIDTDGAGWCWGANTDGRLGDNTFSERHSPVRVTVAGTWETLDAGFQHTCGVTAGGAGWCWGWNSQGQLADGTDVTTYFPEPKANQLPGTWTDVAAGYFGSAGTKGSGTAWSWGSGEHGELGNGPSDRSLVPLRVPVAP